MSAAGSLAKSGLPMQGLNAAHVPVVVMVRLVTTNSEEDE